MRETDSPKLDDTHPTSEAHVPADIINEIRAASQPRTEFYVMNLFAAIVASYGLLSNSAAVVIGAMVIATMLAPISGIALALVTRDRTLLQRAGLALGTGSLEVYAVAFLIGSIHVQIPLTQELLMRTQPNLFDLIIALSGGAAGAYALGRRTPGGTLIGVAIATALVPPIAASAIAGAHGNWALAGHAALLFVTNLVAIQCSYSIVLYLLDVVPRRMETHTVYSVVKRMAPSLALLLVLAVVLGIVLERSVVRQQLESHIRVSLGSALRAVPGASLGDVVVYSQDSVYDVIASVRTATPIAPDTVRAIEDGMRQSLDKPVRLTVRSELLRVANREGYLYEPQALRAALDQPQAGNIAARDTLATIDSVRTQVIGLLVRDSLLRDSLRLDSLRTDSVRLDSLRRDSIRAHKGRSRR